jgi:choline monooxygenase
MPPPITIDPDIRRAQTMPGWFYRDPAVHAWAREHVFARSWQLVPGAEWTDVPGNAMPFTFLEGCVDEPLLLTRDDQDRLHCLSNVCTHRGNLVVMEPCRGAHLRCIYHGRRFTLDGRFASMPEFDGVAGFPSPSDDLRRLRVERWGPFVFVAIDPAFGFDAWTEPMRARLAGLPLDRLVFDRSRSRDYLVAANWALYCDNYLEGFHIPYVHAALTDAIDYGSYRTELDEWSSVQIALGTGGDHLLTLPPDAPDHGTNVAAYYFWLFPNLMFNVYAWGISVNVVRPLAADRTKVSFLAYVWDESKLGGGAGAQLDRVEREDEMIVEACQRGIASRLYERGRYSPAREQGVHHFHRLLGRRIGDSYHFPSSHGGPPQAPERSM